MRQRLLHSFHLFTPRLVLIVVLLLSWRLDIGDSFSIGAVVTTNTKSTKSSGTTPTTTTSTTQQQCRRSIASSSYSLTATSTTTRLYQAAASSSGAARAGSQGYSLLRQPVQEAWNAEKDPVFDVPKSGTSTDKNNESLASWWTNRQQRQRSSSSSTSILTNDDTDDGWTNHDNYRRFEDSLGNRRNGKNANDKEDDDDNNEDRPVNVLQRTYETLDIPKLQRALFQCCTTVPGRQFVMMENDNTDDNNSNFFLANSVTACRSNYQAIYEWRELQNDYTTPIRYKNRLGYQQQYIGNPLSGNSFPLAVLLQLQDDDTANAILEGEELNLIAKMLDTMEDIVLWREAIRRHVASKGNSNNATSSILVELTNDIQVNSTLQNLLHSAFDENGRLDGETFPSIGMLRSQIRRRKADILETVQTLVSTTLQNKLALESGGAAISEINGHLVVPVASKYAASVGISHDQSRSGKTIFVEPHAIVLPTNELRSLEQQLQKQEADVWQWLTANVFANRASLERNLYCIGQLDLVFARSTLGERLKGVIPTVQDEGIISLKNAKHPILLLRNNVDVVGSDVSLGANGNQGLVLTGPNAGGKTVILKLLGLLALMVRCGIPVPADQEENPRVDFFDPVLADIGDLQSVGGDLSTFSGHMLVCKQVLENSGRNALVLMDELGSGTDPNQGVAIAQALLEAVVAVGARVVITTHYMQLKQLAAADDRFAVAGMQFVKGKPTYKLLPGTVGESFALSVAERLGLPQPVLARAYVLLDSETRKMGDLLRDMEDQKALVDQQAEELANQKVELANLQRQMMEERIRLEKQQLEARRLEARKFAKLLEEKEQVLEDVMQKLKADPSRRILVKSWNDIKLVRRDVLDEAENVPSVIAKDMARAIELEEELVPIAELRDKPDLKPGDAVIVCKKGPMFGKEAVVKSASGKSVVLKILNSTLNLKTTDVALPNRRTGSSPPVLSKQKNARERAVLKALAEEGTQRKQRNDDEPAQSRSSKVLIRTVSNTVDVLGCNLEAAQERIRSKISFALLSSNSGGVIYVLHGHGTGGVLKSKIRNWLKSEASVASFQPADASNGGDALTCVVLK